MSNKLFASSVNTSALHVARETIEVGVNEAGIPVVRVAFARGKGTGSQEIPVSELSAIIDALQSYADNGLNRSSKVFSAADMLHATISVAEESRVSFRLSSGKGAKPTNLSQDELGDVVSFLREVQPMVEAAASKIKK